jgi:hypothetical protein
MYIASIFEREVYHFVLRSINSLILFEIWKNCLGNGGLLFYRFVGKAVKVTVPVTDVYYFY